MKPIVIGIAGGTCSGKTSIALRLKKTFESNASVVIIKEDDYYKNQDHLTMEERVKTNYDHPYAFDRDLMIQQLDLLINRVGIEKPIYDYVNHTRSKEIEKVFPSDVIVLEGLFVLENEEILKRLDIKIFVDTPSDIRFIRRLLRDTKERGRTIDSIVTQYIDTVRIMHEQFVEPSKRNADIIIPEGSKNEVAIDLLTTKISSIISQNVLQ
ncbi:uridine kinase [Erysipelotrichaceae bacterium OH741_COT-311]|nr:uridine kinase [Erysipelotrichaceae bacterium OH741_COT-311]